MQQQTLEISPTFFALLGYQAGACPPEQQGSWDYAHYLQRLHPADRGSFTALLTELVASRQSRFTLRVRLRHQYGIWCWLEVNAARLPLASVSSTHDHDEVASCSVLLTFKDISEFKQLEAAVQDSQIRYRSLLRTSPLALVFWNREGLISEWSQRAEQMFGWRSEEVIGRPVHRLLFQEAMRQSFALSIRALLAGEADGRFSTINLCKDGSQRHCEWSSVVLRNNQGQLLGIMSLVLDQTEQRQAELRLRQQEMQRQQELTVMVEERTRALEQAHLTLKRIVESSPVPMFVLDSDNQITHWNHACEQVLGYPAREMLGTRRQWEPFYSQSRPVLADLVMSADRTTLAALYPHSIRPSTMVEGAFEAENFFHKQNRWFAFTAVPIRDAFGSVIGAIEALIDTTERHQAEDALRKAKQLADQTAQMKSEFLANVSHEIRTPMNAVIGLAYLLLKTDLNPRQHDYVAKIHGAGKLLLALINDVLDFSKLEAGKLRIEQHPFELDEVLNNIALLVQTAAQEKKLELHFDVAPEVPRLLIGDSLRISQILVNLIGNALKFTAKGFVAAFIRCLASEGDQVRLEFSVRDSGIGMSQEAREHLFEAFSQADSSTTRKYGGTGLGLVISRRLVNLMGGELQVSSTPGEGSTFTFTLLLTRGSESTVEAVLNSASGHVETCQPRRPALVVDDHPLARTVVVGLLKKLGYTAQTADSGAMALQLLHQAVAQGQPFERVFLDWNMPDLDGLAVARSIRSEIRPVPRIVMVTGAAPETLEEAAALGEIDAVLTKPVIYAQLARVLSQLESALPLGRMTGRVVDQSAGQIAPATTNSRPLADMQVLLVEDIPTNQMIAREIIEALGATVEIAHNGLDALNRLEQQRQRFDVVLMDVQMPEMDGLEATRRLRSRAEFRHLPIIAMTAHALDEERERCRNAGMDEFLTKPIDPSALAATLVRWYNRTRSRLGVAAADSPVMAAASQSAAPSARPGGATFISLPGIDTEDGLRRMVNKPALYEKVLKDFYHRFWNETAEIHQALQSGEREAALRRVHSIKGLAGSVGAKALQQAALDLEMAVRAEEPPERLPLAGFAIQLNLVINGLNAAYHLDR
jgi:PAS domain S-box-containing protein